MVSKKGGRAILVLRRKEILTQNKTQMNIEDILLAKGCQVPRTNIVQLDLLEESRRVYLEQVVSGTCPEMKNRKLMFNGHNAFHLCKIKESPGGGRKKMAQPSGARTSSSC